MKIAKIILAVTVLANIFVINVYAEYNDNYYTASNSNIVIETRGEITGYKYKYFNGVKYKRLWSYTYNRWIDPEWTLA